MRRFSFRPPLEFRGRKFKGLAPDGPHFFVLTELPDLQDTPELPPVALLLRVSSYTEFRDGFLQEDERKGLKAEPVCRVPCQTRSSWSRS